eukprot:3728147-Rhodomonas_salina.5
MTAAAVEFVDGWYRWRSYLLCPCYGMSGTDTICPVLTRRISLMRLLRHVQYFHSVSPMRPLAPGTATPYPQTADEVVLTKRILKQQAQ